VAKHRTRRNIPLFDGVETDTGAIPDPPDREETVELIEAAETRYLNYALSVITARALPDVRDGLKPVQRRILYTMWEQRLSADSKPRKSAKVVGDVMGSYHPHGDSALYDTLVRMAQPFALRYPLIDGHGNFGSLDGDSAAAMRYTECRLAPPSAELLKEIAQNTVSFRPNYDSSTTEPIVLPARLPNLLINGATGIAVGMATNIPPHHVGEVCTALLELLANPELNSVQLCAYVKGPDFPTGGQILNTPHELEQIYETGSGTIRVRATWEPGPNVNSGKTIHITSIPYAVNKSQLVERIAEVILARKLPPLVDVKDLSTDEVRVEIELKPDADAKMVMSYLYKNTPLQTNFAVNLTCLVPTEYPEVCRPERLNLHQLLWHFLRFRLEIVTRRLEHELATLHRRIHSLEGFEIVFDALDEVLRIVRKSDGKADAAAKIMQRFALDAEQTDAILELKIYRLARLEIEVIRKELAIKRAQSHEIDRLLRDETLRWNLVRDEIREIKQVYGNPRTDPRRTVIESAETEVDYSADDFIVAEDAIVLVTTDGWIKRQKEVRDLTSTRLREGDTLLSAVAGSTRTTCVFFSSFGIAYTARITDVPATTGHGEPIQRLFKLKDHERIVTVMSLDPRVTPDITATQPGAPPPVHAVSVTSDGYSLRFSLESFIEPSTRAGRRFARPGTGSEVVGVARTTGAEIIIAATAQARAILCAASEVNFLSGPGRGVILIKIKQDTDRVLGFIASTGDRDLLLVETNRGATQTVSTGKYGISGRGGRGRELMQRGQFIRVVRPQLTVPALGE
jgi:DNA gyrase subunit A